MRSIPFRSFSAMILCCVLSSCAGYKFRSEENSALKSEGIRRIFFRGVKNNSQKSGIEHLIATGLKEKLQSSGGIKIVYEEAEADAVLESRILKAETHAVVLTPSENLYPSTNISVAKALIGSEYEAILNCEYILKKTERTLGGLSREELKKINEDALKDAVNGALSAQDSSHRPSTLVEKDHLDSIVKEKIVFLRSFQNSRRYLGSNQKGSYGTTSALISESEFDRALDELTKTQMREVQEALLSRF